MANSKTITVAASMEPVLNRRQMLTGIAAASASVAVVATPSPAKSATVTNLPEENPDLLQAHADLLAARAEQEEAKAALEGLADEWKHRWPLAPEELLEGANAQSGYGVGKNAERDILGRYLMRDTSVLTKRFTAKQHQETPRTCFYLLTAARAEEVISNLEKCTPSGRTEKSLARNRADLDEGIRSCRNRLPVAKAYEAETARLRMMSGVDAAKERIRQAELKIDNLASDISYLPALTQEGINIKADALAENSVLKSELRKFGVIGEIVHFVEAVRGLGGRA
jgi:hypothetical protein